MGDTMTTLFGLLLLLFATILVKLWMSHPATHPPYPPGPKPSLLSGKIRVIPTITPWYMYTSWAKIYGSVIHFKEFTQHIVIINTVEDAIALFENRSRIYSNRPVITIINMMGWDFNTGLLPYGKRWQRHRRIYQQNFKKEMTVNYRPTQRRKIHEMLYALLTKPEDFISHCRTTAAAVVMATMYDSKISSADVNRFTLMVEEAAIKVNQVFFPGAVLVNVFPFLRHLPSWLPFAGFKRFAEGCKVGTEKIQNIPFNFVKERMAAGAEISGLVVDLLQRNDARGAAADQEEDIKSVITTAFAAGAETSASALEAFFYAMVANPDAQQRGQEEIDRVVGTHRLPDYGDHDSLPYVEAIFREVMRWRPIAPLGVPHSTSLDDVYNGYYIPKGTIVMANIWAMTHDELKYPQPDIFIPERFLKENGEINDDEHILGFGFGRRICPGRHMASATLWLAIATVLSTFNIAKAKDADGNEIPVDDTHSDGFIIHKLPYRSVITPRSKEARKLILESYAENSNSDNAQTQISLFKG